MFASVNQAQTQEICNLAVETPTVVPRLSTFGASIVARDIPDQNGGMAGWELMLSWNQSVIQCISETVNLGIWGTGNYLGPWVSNPINNTGGTYHQSLTFKVPGVPVEGTYWLTNLTFQAIGQRDSHTDLTLMPVQGWVYCLTDRYSNEIAHEFLNAQITVGSDLPFEVTADWKPTCPYPYVSSNVVRQHEPILITANISSSNMERVELFYKVNSGEWWNTSMIYNATVDLWTTLMPGQEENVSVNFGVLARDWSGNTASCYDTFVVKDLLIGDINADGYVNAKDAIILGVRFGQHT